MRDDIAEYNPHRNSIDFYTTAGYMLRSSDYWEAEKNLKTTPGSDCALKFPRRLLEFYLLERLLRFCWRKDYWGCWGKISAIMILMTLKIRISVNFGKGICNQDFQGLKMQFIDLESILKYKNKSIEDTFCN